VHRGNVYGDFAMMAADIVIGTMPVIITVTITHF